MYDDTDTDGTRSDRRPATDEQPDSDADTRADGRGATDAPPARSQPTRGRVPRAGGRGPPRPPWLYRLVRDRSGQSETIGVALMLAIAAIGVTAVVALGSTALTDTQSSADLQRTEHAMTLLDSRGAMTALGESESQQVTLGGSGNGGYTVEPDTGRIVVEHKNYTGTDDEEIFNRTLGSVYYTTGDTVIAYQGGGIWRTQDNGTTMVSPPELHYRDQTLTMPLIRVTGSGSASGSVTATVSPVSDDSTTRIFSNDTTTYADGSRYDNPVQNGTVVVTVHSEHYQGWATYFDERTEGNLTVDHAAQTASIELGTLSGAPGAFDMPGVGDSLEVPSVATNHNVSQFELTLEPDSSNDNAFQQLHWSLYHQGSNGQQFELHFRGNGRCQSGSYNDEIGVSVYYRHNSSAPSEEWETTIADPNDDADENLAYVDCTGDVPVLHANLTSSHPMAYKDIDIPGSDNKWHFGNEIKEQDAPSTLEFSQHTEDAGHGPYTKGTDDEELGFLIDHYFSRMAPDFELTVDAGPGNSHNRVDESESSGVLWYDTIEGEEYVQYLHLTENEIRVELDA